MKSILKRSKTLLFLSELDPVERNKFLILMTLFSVSIAVYSIIRSLKTSIFLSMVGVEYQPLTKLFTLGLIIPVMYIYSKIVDKHSVYGVAYFWFILYGTICLTLSCFMLHPVYGLANTDAGPHRYIGWISYFTFELYASLVLSTVWAFINSISTPESAEKGYGLINAGGRISGFLMAGIGGSLFAYSYIPEQYIASGMLFTAGCLLLSMAGIIYWGMCTIPADHLKGYRKVHEDKETKKKRVGFVAGFQTILHHRSMIRKIHIYWIGYAKWSK